MPTDNTAPGSMLYEWMTGTILQPTHRWIDEEILRTALAVCQDSMEAHDDAAALIRVDRPITHAKQRLIAYHESAMNRACTLRDQIHKLLQSPPADPSPPPSITLTPNH